MFPGSLVSAAEILAVPELCKLAGGAVPKETESGKVTMAEADLVLSVAEVAVMATLPPVGAVDGAVKTVAAPLVVDVGLKVPQAAAGAQLQVTPLPDESFNTIADTFAVAPVASDAGGAAENETEMGSGVGLGPEELPPPQPQITARASDARMSGFLMNSP
jgi:hypothetical protein